MAPGTIKQNKTGSVIGGARSEENILTVQAGARGIHGLA